ncbi:unnamed protein product [Cuscuta europaea]|uniref:Uncharacterized protein n=1 Tax=Cuscuta europaea TaxID=41803 RepID=A0A9P0ZP26_CUSEU|nr:unnamed protein product [Cuscuta europaea]
MLSVEEVINWLKRKNDQLIEQCKQLQSESERGLSHLVDDMGTGRLLDECSSYMFPTRQEEKEILHMKVKKLKVNKKDIRKKLFMVEAELENMKNTHVSKAEFERVIVKLVIVGFVLVCVSVSIALIVVRKNVR